jgi:molecular chaperone HscB
MTTAVGSKCSGCGASAPGGEVCPECSRLQPYATGADHWSVLGLERGLGLDRADLERRFHALNRRFHPDYFRLRSAEEQAASLENSASVNAAYRALRDPVARVEYLLELSGLGLGTAGQSRPPADLFEEIMELQEARQELEMAGPGAPAELRERLAGARSDLETRREQTQAELVALFPGWDVADEAERGRLLRRMRDILATRAYLGTIVRDLGAALDRTNGRGD